ncbi:protein PIMREG-like isoform X1 [Leucoraja erinacea]|uniref:protein PIMREG-like isoform X1 n=1 Tax=Leucoraja erinaceus TaxID=7782 RepID=UPI002457A1D8|nr:protein PIMREG-like isoform X1 [Leucoraja erinacea]
MECGLSRWRQRQQHRPLQESGDRGVGVAGRRCRGLGAALRTRLPLGRVDDNAEPSPARHSDGSSNKPGALHSLGRSARNTWGNVSQRLQKRRQGRGEFLVVTPSKPQTPRGRRCGPASRRRSSPRTPVGGGLRFSPPSGTPTPTGSKAKWSDVALLLGTDGLPLRRSVRAASLKSPYGSPRGTNRQRQFDRDLESVSFGIGQLQRLSHVFDETIAKEERARAVENYRRVMSENVQVSEIRARKLSSSSVRRTTIRLRSALSSLADEALANVAERRRERN